MNQETIKSRPEQNRKSGEHFCCNKIILLSTNMQMSGLKHGDFQRLLRVMSDINRDLGEFLYSSTWPKIHAPSQWSIHALWNSRRWVYTITFISIMYMIYKYDVYYLVSICVITIMRLIGIRTQSREGNRPNIPTQGGTGTIYQTRRNRGTTTQWREE